MSWEKRRAGGGGDVGWLAEAICAGSFSSCTMLALMNMLSHAQIQNKRGRPPSSTVEVKKSRLVSKTND